MRASTAPCGRATSHWPTRALSCTSTPPNRGCAPSSRNGVPPTRVSGSVLPDAAGAVLGHRQFGQLRHRRLGGGLVERDAAVLEHVDPVAELQNLGVVV